MTIKIEKKHIFALLLLLIPFWLIGISSYFFSSASFQYVPDAESIIGMSRQWVGHGDGILMTIIITVLIIALWVAGLCTKVLDRVIDNLINAATRKIQFIKENSRKVLLHMGIFLAIAIAALAVEFIFLSARFHHYAFLARVVRVTFYLAVGLSAYCIVVFRRRPEALFLSLSLIIGFLYIAAQPTMWYGWDNGIHFAVAFEESFVRNVSVSPADLILAQAPEFHSFYLHEAAQGYEGVLHGHENATLYTFRKGTDTISWFAEMNRSIYTRLAHMSQGLMIFIGRSLAIPPIYIVRMVPMINHLIYTLLVYFAIKRLNSGKYIMAVIAMFPTAFVLSTTFGYDHWLIGFLMLGFAYFFYETQTPEKKIGKTGIFILIGSFFIGMSAKAVYFPLMLILYFIKREKFNTQKGYRNYMIAVTCAILFVIASFAIPFLAVGGGEGDWRGGENVSGAGQLTFVLTNPITYAGILLRFLVRHFNILSHNFITYFAHYRDASFLHVVLLLLGFVTITDRSKTEIITSTVRHKVIIAFLVFATAAVYSTAMYIGFTEVGEHFIAGVQGRYLIPMLFPALYILGSFKIQNNINKAAYTCCIFGIMSFVLLSGAWEKFIPK